MHCAPYRQSIAFLSKCLSRFSNHPSLVTQPRYLSGATFANAARQQCQVDRPIFRLYIIQTLALLALYSFSVNEGAQAWYDLGAANRIAQIISLKVDPDAARPAGIAEVSHQELEAFLQIAKALYVMERLFISGTPSRPIMIAEMDFFFDLDNKGLPVSSAGMQAVNSPVEDPLRMSDESPHIIQLLSVWEQISLFEREGFMDLDPSPWNSQSRFQELRHMLDDWMLQLPKDLQFSSETLALRISEGKGAQLVFIHWYNVSRKALTQVCIIIAVLFSTGYFFQSCLGSRNSEGRQYFSSRSDRINALIVPLGTILELLFNKTVFQS
jgi:hypothetical protein